MCLFVGYVISCVFLIGTNKVTVYYNAADQASCIGRTNINIPCMPMHSNSTLNEYQKDF